MLRALARPSAIQLLPIPDAEKLNGHFSRIKGLKKVVFSSKMRKGRENSDKVRKQRKPYQFERGIAEGKSH